MPGCRHFPGHGPFYRDQRHVVWWWSFVDWCVTPGWEASSIQVGAASTDCTVLVQPVPENRTSSNSTQVTLGKPVKAILPLALTPLDEPYLLIGSDDTLYCYDLSTIAEPEELGKVDAHWHNIMAIRLWMKKEELDLGRSRLTPFLITASLDGTIRRWPLAGP
jgi:hypothetical protein